MSAAFDNISQNILLDRLDEIGITDLRSNNDNSILINCTNNILIWLINNNLLVNIDKTQMS